MHLHHVFPAFNFATPQWQHLIKNSLNKLTIAASISQTTAITALFKIKKVRLKNTLTRTLLFVMLACLHPTLGHCNNTPTTDSNLNATTLPPAVQLARIYDDTTNVQDYLVSEKYDGIRAIWKNGKLQTRNGNTIHAPKWFTKDLPNTWLDGELWSKRQDFEFIASTVRKHTPNDSDWKHIRYMVFDAPNPTQTFQKRAKYYKQLIETLALKHVKPVKQFRANNNEQLSSLLKNYTNAGAEGLMLHKANAMYSDGRSSNLLKLKPYMDAEAIVIEHLPGKGKYKGLMGSIKVRWETGANTFVEFKIGTGFSEKERANPPKIGSTITFKYHGLTKNKLPRFASFLRVNKAAKQGKSD